MAVLFEFDPTSEDATNAPLEIWSTATYAVTKFDSPAPSPRPQWASSVDTEGSLLTSVTHENRQISLTIEVMSAAGLRALQAKFGKVTREGGTAKLTFPNSEVVIFDLLMGDSFAPQLDIAYYANSGVWCTVDVALVAKPYGRGPSVTLADHVETSAPALVFTETGIKGDWYGLGSLIIDNDQSGTTQTTMIWGIESRNIVSTSIPLLVEGENTTYISSVVGGTAAVAGASGGNAFQRVSVGPTSTTTLVGRFTTIGTFRVYARVLAPVANTAAITLQLQNGNIGSSSLSLNDPVTLDTAWEDTWRLVDLGQVTGRKSPTSSVGDWLFGLLASSTVTSQTINIDYFLIVPITEGSGVLTDTADPILSTTFSTTNGGVRLKWNDVQRWGGGYLGLFPGLDRPQKYEGDYLLIPPAGAENRSVRFIVKMSRGRITQDADAGIDDLSARLTYTPRYLVVPSP